MSRDKPEDLITLALEASIYVTPTDHGLTESEIVEVGGRLGSGPGAIRDALRQLKHGPAQDDDGRIRLVNVGPLVASFIYELEPDFRNRKAFEFVLEHVQELVEAEGLAQARIGRAVLVSAGVASGVPDHDLEVAITLLALDERLLLADGQVRLNPATKDWPLPSEQVKARRPEHRKDRPLLERVMPLVKMVIDARQRGSHQSGVESPGSDGQQLVETKGGGTEVVASLEQRVLDFVSASEFERGKLTPVVDVALEFSLETGEVHEVLASLEAQTLVELGGINRSEVCLKPRGVLSSSGAAAWEALGGRVMEYLRGRLLTERSSFTEYTWEEVVAAEVATVDQFKSLVRLVEVFQLSSGGSQSPETPSARWRVPPFVLKLRDFATLRDLTDLLQPPPPSSAGEPPLLSQRTVLALADLAESCFEEMNVVAIGLFADLLFEYEFDDWIVTDVRQQKRVRGVSKQIVLDLWVASENLWGSQRRSEQFLRLAGALLEYTTRPRTKTLVYMKPERIKEAQDRLRRPGRIILPPPSRHDLSESCSETRIWRRPLWRSLPWSLEC